MSKGGSVGSQGTTQQARGSFSGNSRPSYGGNQAGGLGSKGGSQSYQEPYRSPYGQGPSYSQNGMRSGFGGFMENPQAIPTQLPSQLPFDYGNSTSTPSGGQMMMFQPPRRQEEARTRGPESFDRQSQMLQGQTFQPGTITSDMMRFTAQPVASIARLPGTPAPPRMFTDQLTGKQVTQAEVDSLGGIQTFLDSNAPKQERNLQDRQYGQVAPQQFSGGFGSKGGLMNQTDRGYRSGIGGFF